MVKVLMMVTALVHVLITSMVSSDMAKAAARQCDQKTREAQKYHYGYIQGVEDLLKVIRRGEQMDAVNVMQS